MKISIDKYELLNIINILKFDYYLKLIIKYYNKC